MRFFFTFLFLTLFCPLFSYSQDPEKPSSEITGDTIEGISTDSSIIYIIKKPPVKIKEKVEIQREKKKKYYYLTLGIAPFVNTNTYKAHSGQEAYVSTLNAATRSKPGFSCIFQLYYIPAKKYLLGLSIEGRKTVEQFEYTPLNAEKTTFTNSYTYGGVSILLGKWYRKEERISYQLMTYPVVTYKYAVSGYSLNSKNTASILYIAESIAYKRFNLSLFLTCKFLYRTKNSFIEVAPYAHLDPFSMTKKSENFSIRRNSFGIYLALTNKLF